jgi:hypothetical protein
VGRAFVSLFIHRSGLIQASSSRQRVAWSSIAVMTLKASVVSGTGMSAQP